MEITIISDGNQFRFQGLSKDQPSIDGHRNFYWGLFTTHFMGTTFPVPTKQGIYYLNCDSFRSWCKKVKSAVKDDEISAAINDPIIFKHMIQSAMQEATNRANRADATAKERLEATNANVKVKPPPSPSLPSNQNIHSIRPMLKLFEFNKSFEFDKLNFKLIHEIENKYPCIHRISRKNSILRQVNKR